MKQVFLVVLHYDPEKPKSIDNYFRNFVNVLIYQLMKY